MKKIVGLILVAAFAMMLASMSVSAIETCDYQESFCSTWCEGSLAILQCNGDGTYTYECMCGVDSPYSGQHWEGTCSPKLAE